MTYRKTLLAAVLVVGALAAGAPASAAPVGAIPKALAADTVNLQAIDWRPYRHCHRRHGRKWCHGGRRSGYSGYGYQPGVSIYIGPRHRHRHHHRHYKRRH